MHSNPVQGSTGVYGKMPVMKTGVLQWEEGSLPCNENRFFPVRIDLQGVPFKPYMGWVCSAPCACFASLHRGAFCQFPFWWIYYYGNNNFYRKRKLAQYTFLSLQDSCFHYTHFPVNPCTSLYGIAVSLFLLHFYICLVLDVLV